MAIQTQERVSLRQSRPPARRVVDAIVGFFVKKPLGALGLMIILVMALMAALAPIAATHSPTRMDFMAQLSGPSTSHWLGTDDFGRDLWSRLLYGARISLWVGFASVAVGSVSGAFFGLISAYYGGKTDQAIQRIMDALMAIPTLILALTIIAGLGQSMTNVIIAIAVPQIPRANRIVRSQALSAKQTEFTMAARAIGATDIRIMGIHILPQCIAPWLIIATAGLGGAIISESSLAFLGMGVPAPAPTWGGMLSGRAREYFHVAPWLAIWPGLAISLVVYGFNLFGDAIRDVLDPRLRGT